MKISMQTSFQQSRSKSLKKILLAGVAVVAFNSIQSISHADEAEERQRDPQHLGTVGVLEFAPGVQEGAKLRDVMELKDQQDLNLVFMAQGMDPKLGKAEAIQIIAPQNVIVDVNFGKWQETAKGFSLGDNGLAGAAPFTLGAIPEKKGLWDMLTSIFIDFSTGALDYYNTPSTVEDFQADAVTDRFVQGRQIQKDVLSGLRSDIDNNFFERAAVGEYLSRSAGKDFINPGRIIANLTGNPIARANFDRGGMYSGIVESAMSLEYLTFSGQYFGQIQVGAVNSPLAVRKLNLQATSPFIEEQRRAYGLYRYGID